MNDNEFQRFMVSNATTLQREVLQRLMSQDRNINYECGYPETLTIFDYQAMFDREGVGARVVMLFPEECWNVTPEIVETEDTQESKFEKAWKDLEQKHQIWHYLQRLDILCGIGQYGVLLLGINDGKDLSEPVEGNNKELIYLKPYSENYITIKETEIDTKSPRYGHPTVYGLKSLNKQGQLDSTLREIHWTRIIHVADNALNSDIFGEPRMRPVFNRLWDIRKIMAGSGEMFWKGGFPGYAFEVSPERHEPLSTDEKEELREEFLKYSNGLQRYLAVTGVSAKSLSPQVADPTAHFTTHVKAISLTMGVPYRVFLGSEEAKLASTTDTKTWHRRVEKRQVGFITPSIVRPFIDRISSFGIIEAPEGYEVVWPRLDELDEKEQSQIAKDTTEAMSKYVSSGADVLMPPEQFLTKVLHYSDEEAKAMIVEAAKWVDDKEPEDDDGKEPVED